MPWSTAITSITGSTKCSVLRLFVIVAETNSILHYQSWEPKMMFTSADVCKILWCSCYSVILLYTIWNTRVFRPRPCSSCVRILKNLIHRMFVLTSEDECSKCIVEDRIWDKKTPTLVSAVESWDFVRGGNLSQAAVNLKNLQPWANFIKQDSTRSTEHRISWVDIGDYLTPDMLAIRE